ncbi:NADH-quinone oxidoreductase subunit C [Fibrella aquatilis]|uniref:NADH-quinone oxidoreductase subunit C n=1 Tax=Fibrella aquatilis TaxID=2817059 RepID=A0A939JYZ9_9BACT|nr:NADH-quinone oxidoreductase subunit C [Fibrella aquatilis]MBO0934537.1 NADH-quinone oxidoreductase subunit C [Fibrella aquatilis]
MIFPDITALLAQRFTVTAVEGAFQSYLTVEAGELVALCQFLRNDERLFFDLLACVTAIDNGVEVGTMEVIYNLTSIPYGHDLMLKLTIPRPVQTQQALDLEEVSAVVLPDVPSLASVWRTADWHEREAFDLVGIRFTNHPDLRRILLPTDWTGHPLRRDYQEAERYHGISTK